MDYFKNPHLGVDYFKNPHLGVDSKELTHTFNNSVTSPVYVKFVIMLMEC